MPNASHKTWKIIALITSIDVVLIGVYYGYLETEILNFYAGKESWLAWITELLYPRFSVEKYRFSADFFLQKTEQILYRVVIGSWIVALIYISSQKKKFFENFWQISTTYHRVRFLQLFLIAGWLYESFTWYQSLLRLSQASVFYEAHLLFRWLAFPSQEAIFYGFALLYALWLLSFLPKYGSIFWLLATLEIICLQAFLYGFGKLDHTYATWTYTSLLFTFLLREAEKNKVAPIIHAWALKLMQVVVACVYLQVALEKLLISGTDWFLPSTMQTHLITHPTALGLWIAQYPFLCSLLSTLAILWQLSFVCILFFPSLKIPILLTGVLFHTFTFILMNVGGFPSYWFLIYVIWFLEKKLPES
ncbi:MAG: hypothetical protein RMJ97_07460 [Raineya sp.]|nr:hypothetical protein [Raineya sp.]